MIASPILTSRIFIMGMARLSLMILGFQSSRRILSHSEAFLARENFPVGQDSDPDRFGHFKVR